MQVQVIVVVDQFTPTPKLYSGGGPIHAHVPIHAHPQFSQRFELFHGKVYHIIGNYQIDHIHR